MSDELNKSAQPMLAAMSRYAGVYAAALLVSGDWGEVADAHLDLVTEQARWMGGFAAARSGAATELEFYL